MGQLTSNLMINISADFLHGNPSVILCEFVETPGGCAELPAPPKLC
jgi:hypothetical protein